MKTLIDAPSYKVLVILIRQTPDDLDAIDNELLYISVGGVRAIGVVTSDGFVVMKNATIDEASSKSLSLGIPKLRGQIMFDDKVKGFITTEDILFSSSSAAANFVLGYSVSGPITWKNMDGLFLNKIEKNRVRLVMLNDTCFF